MCSHGDTVEVPLPVFVQDEQRRINAQFISIDRCIAADVQALWAAGLVTLSSCCGHGKTPPAILLGSAADLKLAEAVLNQRRGHDNLELWKWNAEEVVRVGRVSQEVTNG